MTEQQKAAIQEAAEDNFWQDKPESKAAKVYFKMGATEVITNPSKFGLVSSTPSNGEVILAQAYHRITAENQRYKEALERIASIDGGYSWQDNTIKAKTIAQQALKGQNDE